MFEKYDPRKGKRIQLLDETGKLTANAKNFTLMNNEEILEAYTHMIGSRIADEWAISLQRQGRMPTYPPSQGQEANSVGAALAMRKDDWFVQSYREMGGLLARKIPLHKVYQYFYGSEEGNRLPPQTYFTTPQSVPIATQTLHAVGIAFAEKYQKRDRVTVVFCGDGGTSEGDFNEALNFAAVWNAPVIFYVQNNQYAISCPRNRQSKVETLAERGFGFGIEGVQIDGNDVLAVHAVVSLAIEKARKGDGPTLIEGFTYRMGAHTTADDPTKYRRNEEVEAWKNKDPILRTEKYIQAQNIGSEKELESIKKKAKEYAVQEFEKIENAKKPSLEDGYRYMYKEMPDILRLHMESRQAYAKGASS